jgi:hypothetical protein
VAQGVGPEFKSQYCLKKKKRKKRNLLSWAAYCKPVILATLEASTRRITI